MFAIVVINLLIGFVFTCPTAKYSTRIAYSLRLPNVRRDTVYDASLSYLFRDGGGLGKPEILITGDPVTGNGCLRKLAVIGLEEKIVFADRPKGFEYTITNPSMLAYPASYNHFRLSFEDGNIENGKGVVVKWEVFFTPMSLLGASFILGTITKTVFTQYLSALAKYFDSDSKPTEDV
eukprot:gene10095-21032_t